MKVQINDDEIYFDGFLHANLTDLMKAIKLKWDGIGMMCGYEGDGKTTLASQICYLMDPTFSLKRCVFTPKQFIEAVDEAKPGEAIQFDEAHAAFDAKRWRDQGQQAIVSMLTRIRKKQLFILIISPTFFDMVKYIAIHRTRFLIQIRSEGLERGYFNFYNRDRKHRLYVLGKKTEDMKAIKSNFYGRFTKFTPFNEDEYEKKKDAGEQEMRQKDKLKNSVTMIDMKRRGWTNGAIMSLKELLGLSNEKVANEINKRSKYSISKDQIRLIINDYLKEIDK